MTDPSTSIIKTVPAAAALRASAQFNPLRYLRKTVSRQTGEPVLKLDLRYKRAWFRMTCPDGRMLLNPLRITDQMAMFEAKIYLHKDDPSPIATFTSNMLAKNVPGGRYIQAAQDEALNEALDNAGFGVQLTDLTGDEGNSGFGSEIPLSQIMALIGEVEQPTRAERTVNPNPPQTPKSTDVQAAPAPVSDNLKRKEPEEPVEGIPQEVVNPTLTPSPPPETVAPSDVPPANQEELKKAEAVQEPVNETASILRMFGGGTADDCKRDEVPETPTEETADAEVAPQPGEKPTDEKPSFTDDMPVDEILKHMTVDDARELLVTFGACKGWTLGEVMKRRPSSLRFFIYTAKEAGNVLKAASSLFLSELTANRSA